MEKSASQVSGFNADNGSSSSSAYPAPPPPYTPSLLIPLWAAKSQSRRYYFVPPSVVSAVIAVDRSVVMAQQTHKKMLALYLPEGYDFQSFLDEYLPTFVTLGPLAKVRSQPQGSYVAINPNRIVEIYSDSKAPMAQTQVDVEHDVAGRGDHAEGEAIYQFTVEMPIWEVLARIDPVGYTRMLRTMAHVDIGFGIRVGANPRVDYPRLIVSPAAWNMSRAGSSYSR